jgi:DNA-binding transcriptional regulator GbsR (MarR family)
MSKMESREAFKERWRVIEPLYMQTAPRLTLTEIGDMIGLSTSQVSRIKRKAMDENLLNREQVEGARGQMRSDFFYGSIRRAFFPHSQKNVKFRDWVTKEAERMGVTVAELAVSALLDVYYDEVEPQTA